jgi:hypothetical protein
LFHASVTRVITEAELSGLDIAPSMFDNLNTREELERARQREIPWSIR